MDRSDRHVKFYSVNDMSSSWYLQIIEEYINEGIDSIDSNDINNLLLLYNIGEYYKSGLALKTWDDNTKLRLKEFCNGIEPKCGVFFNGISDSRFKEVYIDIKHIYVEDFWHLFSKYNCHKRVSNRTISELLISKPEDVYYILQNKKIVEAYVQEVRLAIIGDPMNAELVLRALLTEDKRKLYIPKSLTSDDYIALYKEYIDTKTCNPNYLNLLCKSRIDEKHGITDKVKLLAEERYEERLSELVVPGSGFGDGIEIIYDNIDSCEDVVTATRTSDNIVRLKYSNSWVDENQDYPTLLNNFIFLFGFVDRCFRCTFVSPQSKLSSFEKHLGVKGKEFFPRGVFFECADRNASANMCAYYNKLKELDIEIEDVYSWFFSTYLLEEFNVRGFSYHPSSKDASYLEKCKNVATEMDGIFKQFKLYVDEGEINQRLLEISSKSVPILQIPSLMANKYVYFDSEEIKDIMSAFFSDQTIINFTSKVPIGKYKSFAALIMGETINIDDYQEYQQSIVNQIKELGYIEINKEGFISADFDALYLLKDMYDHGVICNYYNKKTKSIEAWNERGFIRYESKLFSEPEQDYFEFMLNQQKYSDGHDLRNRYIHVSYKRDERIHQHDYFELLKLMAIVIIKINEEFCRTHEEAGEK